MGNKILSIEEIRDALISNTSPLRPSEIADIIASKNIRQLKRRIKKYAKIYNK